MWPRLSKGAEESPSDIKDPSKVTPLSLQEYLSREIGYDAERMDGTPDPALARLITRHLRGLQRKSAPKFAGALAGVLGLAGSENVQGEDRKKLDIISNDILWRLSLSTGSVCGMVKRGSTRTHRCS